LSHTSLVHGQCSDRPLVNFPAAEHCQLICSHFPPTEDRRLSWPGWLVTCWCSISDVSRTKTWGQQHWVVYLHMGTVLVVSMLDAEWLRWCDPTPWPPGQTATYWGAQLPRSPVRWMLMNVVVDWVVVQQVGELCWTVDRSLCHVAWNHVYCWVIGVWLPTELGIVCVVSISVAPKVCLFCCFGAVLTFQVAKNRFDGELGIMLLKFDKETLSFAVKSATKDDRSNTSWQSSVTVRVLPPASSKDIMSWY